MDNLEGFNELLENSDLNTKLNNLDNSKNDSNNNLKFNLNNNIENEYEVNKNEQKIVEIDDDSNDNTEDNEDTPKTNKELFEEKLSSYLSNNKIKLLIGSMSNSTVSVSYFNSMILMTLYFNKYNIDFEIINITNDSIEHRVKNSISAKFLSDDSYTHLIFIDSNMGFSYKSILNLIMSNKEICGGLPNNSQINWSKVINIIRNINTDENNNIKINQNELISKSLNYNFNPIIYTNENKEKTFKIENNLIECESISSNFMLIKKEALKFMISKYPTLQYKNTIEGYNDEKLKDYFYLLFDYERDIKTGKYYTSNETFCKRWCDLGKELWIDITCNFSINSKFNYTGSLYNILEDSIKLEINNN